MRSPREEPAGRACGDGREAVDGPAGARIGQNAPMQVQKLSSTDAFVVRDLPDAGAIGVVRCAPKILVDGATWLARSVTYACASFEIQAGGASAGVNAKPEGRAEALAAFDAEIAPDVSSGVVVLDPAKGVGVADLPAMAAADPRPADVRAAFPALLAAGIVASAATALRADSLDGRSVAIEGIDLLHPDAASALVDAITAAGGRVVGISAGKGSIIDGAGFAPEALTGAIGSGDTASLLGESPAAANRLLGVEADVLLAGSKAGAIEHSGAAYVKASAVVPWGPVAVSAKALAVLRRAGVTVVPDFVAIAGPLLGWAPTDPTGTDPAAAAERIRASLQEVLDHEHGPFLGACLRAEAYLASWCDEKPFGRPLG